MRQQRAGEDEGVEGGREREGEGEGRTYAGSEAEDWRGEEQGCMQVQEVVEVVAMEVEVEPAGMALRPSEAEGGKRIMVCWEY